MPQAREQITTPTPDIVTAGSFNPGWMAFDVTPRMRQWSNGAAANYGWRVVENPAMPTNAIVFHSSEYATDTTLRPKLTVVYAPPPGQRVADGGHCHAGEWGQHRAGRELCADRECG